MKKRTGRTTAQKGETRITIDPELFIRKAYRFGRPVWEILNSRRRVIGSELDEGMARESALRQAHAMFKPPPSARVYLEKQFLKEAQFSNMAEDLGLKPSFSTTE